MAINKIERSRRARQHVLHKQQECCLGGVDFQVLPVSRMTPVFRVRGHLVALPRVLQDGFKVSTRISICEESTPGVTSGAAGLVVSRLTRSPDLFHYGLREGSLANV